MQKSASYGTSSHSVLLLWIQTVRGMTSVKPHQEFTFTVIFSFLRDSNWLLFNDESNQPSSWATRIPLLLIKSINL